MSEYLRKNSITKYFKCMAYKLQLLCNIKRNIIALYIDVLIPVRREWLDDFHVETVGLFTNYPRCSLLHCHRWTVDTMVVYFKEPKFGGCLRDSNRKYLQADEGSTLHTWPNVVQKLKYPFQEIPTALVLLLSFFAIKLDNNYFGWSAAIYHPSEYAKRKL